MTTQAPLKSFPLKITKSFIHKAYSLSMSDRAIRAGLNEIIAENRKKDLRTKNCKILRPKEVKQFIAEFGEPNGYEVPVNLKPDV